MNPCCYSSSCHLQNDFHSISYSKRYRSLCFYSSCFLLYCRLNKLSKWDSCLSLLGRLQVRKKRVSMEHDSFSSLNQSYIFPYAYVQPFAGGGERWTICPRILASCPYFYEAIERKLGQRTKGKYSYLWIYHMTSCITLKEKAISAISMAKDTYGTIYIIVDYRVGIFPFNVNKCDFADTLLPNGASEISFQPAQKTKLSFCKAWFDSGKLC